MSAATRSGACPTPLFMTVAILPGKATVHCSGPVGGSLMKGRRGRPSSQNLGLGRETINDRFSSGCDRRPSIAYLIANHSVRPRTAYLDTEYASGGSHARRPPTELMLIKWHGRVSLHMSYAVSCGHRRAGRVERGGLVRTQTRERERDRTTPCALRRLLRRRFFRLSFVPSRTLSRPLGSTGRE